MPKRLTATEKWTDPWFCSLTDNEKLFWLYLLDNCNHAGIWEPNWFMFGVYVRNFTFKAEHFQGRIVDLGVKWFIPKFIDFQYGGIAKLNPENKAHASVLALLEKEGASKGLARGLLAPKDMVMVKDKDTEKEVLHKDKVNNKKPPLKAESTNGFDQFWKAYPKKRARQGAFLAWQKNNPPLEGCLKTLDWQKKDPDWLKDGGKYIPYPASWLNDERWHDEAPRPKYIHPSHLEADLQQKARDEADKNTTQEQMQAGIDRYNAVLVKGGFKP